MLNLLLDAVFPRRSLLDAEGDWVTAGDTQSIPFDPSIIGTFALRALGFHSLDRLASAAAYHQSPLLKRAIHTFKYQRVPALADLLSRVLVRMSRVAYRDDMPVMCPVPLHWSRKFQRGFNQSDLLAQALVDARGGSVQHLLRRVRPTGHQAWRHRVDRLTAMQGAFRARHITLPAHVVLIDDLVTTGATLDACAKALKDAGVKRVDSLVIARA